MKKNAIKISLFAALTSASIAQACTSIAWNTEQGVFTSRTNDWVESTNPILGNINKGSVRSLQGAGHGNEYRVKYDIVAVLAYGELVHDGVNSEGLQMNALYYTPMTLQDKSSDDAISQFTVGEYLLANYASVEQAVNALPQLKIQKLKLAGMPMDIKLHWSITDKSGDRAVIELDDSGLKIYRGESAMVMTNDPSLQTHIDSREKYQPSWTNADRNTNFGSKGNASAESRFIHASYYKSKLTEPTSIQNGLMKIASVPFRVPTDAPYKDFGNGMSGYATEWTLSQSLETGDSVMEYNFGENWNTIKFNVYELMGKDFRQPLTVNAIAPLI
ncbi:linear amide C-N hydrolase [Moritella sp. Urea-trap-13]|uniref:linear amide C-N hydrolase n=1 Tax=Moritella sp. Urea-trap-13 TaxID=2058327 RepID=UPI000C334305|nr:linear amide C-N hydrolase [Moritella sp. Urea-trap-13]PKH09384.1 choloylglycine hydrolase [Moritella sp. Urea-trap-13]